MNTKVSRPSSRAFKIKAVDNVATMLEDTSGGPVLICGCSPLSQVDALEPVALGHKIALAPLTPGDAIVKYGTTVGVATTPIAAGAWVHLHNCRSQVDERSNRLDPRTGAAMDTLYA
jgi:altronate dehydratase small subunit